MSLRKSISRFFGLPDQGRDSNVADEDKSNGNSKETKPAYYFGAINFAARRYAAGEARDYTRKMELLHKAIVKQANELALPDFVAKYFPPHEEWETWTPCERLALNPPMNLRVYTAKSLTQARGDLLEICFDLIKRYSEEHYAESSVGWSPANKKTEMKEKDLKYVLAWHDKSVAGFMSFMPTMEDDHPVLYLYEIHLHPYMRAAGLGPLLMRVLEKVAENIGVDKVMLSVFTANERAVKFYQYKGYKIDAFSPCDRVLRGKVIKPDYIIMSKATSRREIARVRSKITVPEKSGQGLLPLAEKAKNDSDTT